ncbi:MAG: DUF4129 domain-containing protein [Herpetosiphonaceae bacterium]|nr:DUF4129 domain-containing protein [Herpetosiphonaceae bacterium]
MRRWLLPISLATMYVCLASLTVFIFGAIGDPVRQPTRWPAMAFVALVTLLTRRAVARLTAGGGSMLVPLVSLATVALMLKSLIGGGLSPFSGWGSFLPDNMPIAQELLFSTTALLLLVGRILIVDTYGPSEVASFFRSSLIYLVVILPVPVFFFNVSYANSALLNTLAGHIIVFMATALLALMLSNSLGHETAGSQRWLVSGGIPVVGLIGGSLLLTALFSSDMRALLFSGLRGISGVVATIFGAVALVIGTIVTVLIDWVSGEPQQPAEMVPADPRTTAADDLNRLVEDMGRSQPVDAAPLFELIGRTITGLLLLLLVWLVVRWGLRYWRNQQQARASAEERTSVWSWAQARQDLNNLWRGWLKSLGRSRAGDELAGDTPALRIRRAYRRLLELGVQAEKARSVDQTAREYGGAANSFVPAATASISQLTTTYEAARYAEVASGAEAAAAEAALAEIEAQARPAQQR